MKGILNFISESAYAEHKEYNNTQKLRYSILEKSEPRLSGLSIGQIERAGGIKRDIRSEAVELLSDIRAHELYFSSFSGGGARSAAARSDFGSEASFLYEILKNTEHFGQGFCFIGVKGGRIFANCTERAVEIYRAGVEPLLAIDLCEHAYFRDYGHKREDYLRRALHYLNISALE